MTSLLRDYPWTEAPFVACAPMRRIAMATLAVTTSAAGGLGFIGAGDDLDELDSVLAEASQQISKIEHLQAIKSTHGVLPVGFGFFNWAPKDKLQKVAEAVEKWEPAAVWMFGAHENQDYATWAQRIRQVGGAQTKVWIQVGCVNDALEVAKTARPDVLIVQGTDAGGHGLNVGAGIITLLPEVSDALRDAGLAHISLVAAGGIVDGRGVAAALALGADGVTLGTRLLASTEAVITNGYRNEVVRASDGGANTARTKIYDQLRGTTSWPQRYNARGVLNRSYHDHAGGVDFETNKRLHDEAMQQGDAGWGVEGRVTTYAGTGVGLVREVKSAAEIVKEVRESAKDRVKAISQ